MNISKEKTNKNSLVKDTVEMLLKRNGKINLALKRKKSEIVLSDQQGNTVEFELNGENDLKIKKKTASKKISQERLLNSINQRLEEKLGSSLNIEKALKGKSLFASLIILKTVLRKLNY